MQLYNFINFNDHLQNCCKSYGFLYVQRPDNTLTQIKLKPHQSYKKILLNCLYLFLCLTLLDINLLTLAFVIFVNINNYQTLLDVFWDLKFRTFLTLVLLCCSGKKANFTEKFSLFSFMQKSQSFSHSFSQFSDGSQPKLHFNLVSSFIGVFKKQSLRILILCILLVDKVVIDALFDALGTLVFQILHFYIQVHGCTKK